MDHNYLSSLERSKLQVNKEMISDKYYSLELKIDFNH